MKAGTRFVIGASVIVVAVGALIYQGVQETGTYFLTTSELDLYFVVLTPLQFLKHLTLQIGQRLMQKMF